MAKHAHLARWLLAAFLLSVSTTFAQSIVYVQATAPPGGNGQSWSTAYQDLAAALAAPPANAEVWIAAGTYTTTVGFTVPSGIRLFGGFAGTELRRDQRDITANPTILSGSNRSTVVILQSASTSTLVDGLAIINGRNIIIPGQRGGGVWIQGGSPTVRDCTIRDCTAGVPEEGPNQWLGLGGGGVYVAGAATPHLDRCWVHHNAGKDGDGISLRGGTGHGGGIYVGGASNVTITDCIIEANHPGNSGTGSCGGGLYHAVEGGTGGGIRIVESTMLIIGSVFRQNASALGRNAFVACASQNLYGAWRGGNGGAIAAANSQLQFFDCVFEANIAPHGGNGSQASYATAPGAAGGSGGAAYLSGGSATFTNTRFVGNIAGDGGSGVDGFIFPFPPPPSFPSTPGANGGQGGAIFSDNTALDLHGCVFTANRAGTGGLGGDFPEPAADGVHGQAGAIYVARGTCRVRNCTVAANTAPAETAGLFFSPESLTTSEIANSILYSNTGLASMGNGSQNRLAQTNATRALYSCVQALAPLLGAGNIVAPPLFADPDGPNNTPGDLDDDYSVLRGSPCIDAAANSSLPGILTSDIRRRPRRRDDPLTSDRGIGLAPIVDMGAYEFQPCVADLDDGRGLGFADGGVTIDDLLYFLDGFSRGLLRADLDDGTNTNTPDGSVTIDDLLYFVFRFQAGC